MAFTHDPASPFPILRHRTWKHLLRALEDGKHRDWVRAGQVRIGEDTSFNHARLSAVVPLAYLLATACPDLCRKPTLRVAVLAGDEYAVADGGRWFRMLGALLGDATTPEVTILYPPGVDPMSLSGNYDPVLERILQSIPPCPTSVGNLAAYLGEGQAPDILYVPFLPIADDFARWVKPSQLPECLAQGTILMGVNAASWAERDVTLALFEAYGVGKGEAIDTPYGLGEIMECPDDWSMGRYGWVLRPSTTGEQDIAWGRVAEVERFWRFFAEHSPEGNDNAHAGQWLRLGADPQGVLAGTRGRGINLKTHQVYSVEYGADGGHLLEHLGDPPNEFAVAMPPDDMPRLDRAMYADHAMAEALFPPGMKEMLKQTQGDVREEGPFRDMLLDALVSVAGFDKADAEARLDAMADAFTAVGGVEAGLPLFVAAEENDAAAITAAIAAGHDPNQRDGEKWTPLCTAAGAGSAEAVTALARAGARLNDATPYGWRPIDLALNRGHSAAAIALLEAGAELDNQPTGFGMKALDVLRSPIAPASVLAWLAARGRSV